MYIQNRFGPDYIRLFGCLSAVFKPVKRKTYTVGTTPQRYIITTIFREILFSTAVSIVTPACLRRPGGGLFSGDHARKLIS